MLELWPFAISGHLMSLLYCVWHTFRTMYANVLKFHILITHEKIDDPYFFLIPITLQRRYNAVAYNAETVITRLGLGSRFFPHQFESVALFPRNAAV